MTNEKPGPLAELKEKLLKDGWEHVATSRDLDVLPEGKEVAVAADMAIGARAEVFLGNGVRSSIHGLITQP